MRKRSTAGLSILAGGLAFVGSASAVDLIGNGSFELGATNWNGVFKTYNFSAAYYTGPAIPASEGPGTKYGWQFASAANGWTNCVTPTNESDHLTYNLKFGCSQTVNLTNALTGVAIDAGLGQYTFSSWLASYGQPGQNPEQPYLVLRFFDNTGTNQIGGNVIFDRALNNNAVIYADGNTTIPADLSADHNWIKYQNIGTVPVGARRATVYILRSPNAALSNSPDTYVDLVKLGVININDTTILDTAVPPDGSTGVSPSPQIVVNLKDISTAVNTNTIQLRLDGSPVTPSISKAGATTTVKFTPPSVLASLSAHTYRISWSDNGTPVTSKTNQFQFTVAPYVNVQLGAPVFLENFDSLTDGGLPAGWSLTNITDLGNIGIDYADLTSDAYTNWAVITRSSLTNVMGTNADYTALLNVAPNQVVNNALVTSLTSGSLALAVSDGRSGQQVQYMLTGDYNLSGKTNVYLSFHSLWTQNQDSMASVEYSIDGGATWLPGLYLLDGPDILRDAIGGIDASNTMATLHTDVPDLVNVTPGNGNYGEFIGVAQGQWAALGPYLSARVNDDQIESKRVEVVRLAQADNHAAVRLRFGTVATDSWFWGVDEVGLYSLATVPPPLITAPPTNTFAGVGNATAMAVGTPLGVGPFSYQWRKNGVNIAGKTNSVLFFVAVQLSDAANYDVVVSNGGASTTSATAQLIIISSVASIKGQWDFNQGDLRATCGNALQYYDLSVQTNTFFGTTTSFSISDINGVPANVMKFTPTSGNSGGSGANPTVEAWGGYKMFHNSGANGGGALLNQWTLIFDVLYPGTSDSSWRAIIQANPVVATGGDDSEFYINTADGIGISGIYNGVVTPDSWHRIALAVDMGLPGPHPVVEKFIDGIKVGEQTTGLDTIDGRYALQTTLALLFAEDNGYNNDAYVSSVQFRNNRLSDVAIAAMGGPSASKIPGAVCANVSGGNLVITWTGTVLQSADNITGPWTTIAGASKPYTVTLPLGARKFYRSM